MERWLIPFLLLVSISFPAVSDYSMAIQIDGAGTASVYAEAYFTDSAEKNVTFCFSGEVSGIELRDKSGLALAPAVNTVEGYSCISFIVPYDYASMSFESYDFTSKNGSYWDFGMKIYSSEQVNSFSAYLVLPYGSVLKKTSGAVSSISSRLEVSWNAENITASKRVNLTAGYDFNPVEDVGGMVLFALLIVIVVVSYLSYRGRYMPGKPEAKPPGPDAKKPKAGEWLESNDVFRTLDEIDKEIVREIAKQKGKTTQAKIYLNTHIPKATLSRRLASLENRGIIQKSQKGNRNLITLNLEKK